MVPVLQPQGRIVGPALLDKIVHDLAVVDHLVLAVQLAILDVLPQLPLHHADSIIRDCRHILVFVSCVINDPLCLVHCGRSPEDDAALVVRLGHASQFILQITHAPLAQPVVRHVSHAPRGPGRQVPQGAVHHDHVGEQLSHHARGPLAQDLVVGYRLPYVRAPLGAVVKGRLQVTVDAHPGVEDEADVELALLVVAPHAVKPVDLAAEALHGVPVYRASQDEDRMIGTAELGQGARVGMEPARHSGTGHQTSHANHRRADHGRNKYVISIVNQIIEP
mmetsp:Transcript_34412/g.90128  ORF Transcript_34412/g.90128 Transcript_34412/m.90128 type:complete len:278 (-) Transcript_34412:2-835(-)